MLIKSLTLGSGDYRQVLKRRVWVGICAILFGITAVVVSVTLLPGSGLPDFMQGFYLGIGSGIGGSALVLIIHSLWLMGHGEKIRAAQIKETDEREEAIATTAAKWSYYLTFFALLVALLIAAPLNHTVFFTLLAVQAVMIVSLLVGMVIARRRM